MCIRDRKNRFDIMKNDWESLKKSRDSIQRLRDEIASLELKAEEMTYNGEYSKVAELRYSKIPEKKKQLEVLEKDSKSDQTVRSDDIANIVEKWTGIPVGKLLEKDAEIYAHLEENLREHVIGPVSYTHLDVYKRQVEEQRQVNRSSSLIFRSFSGPSELTKKEVRTYSIPIERSGFFIKIF